MPEWGWIIIFAVGTPSFFLFLWLIYKRGGKVTTGYGRYSIVINGQSVDEKNPMVQVLKYVTRSIGELEEMLFGRFLTLIRDKGADADKLVEYEDSLYVKQLFHSIVTGGNGSNSWQQTIQEHIIENNWKGQNPHVYAEEEIWPQLLRSAKKYLNAEYYSSVLQPDGSRRDRFVSNTELVDELNSDAIRKRTINAVAAYISYAQETIKEK